MMTWFERYQNARKHVAQGRVIVSRQRDLVDYHKKYGDNATRSGELLTTFEGLQALFEAELDHILDENRILDEA